MVLATRAVPGIQIGHWLWLAVWTLVGGTLAAGSANAINCYIDRDIDVLMSADPAPARCPPTRSTPERAVVFGLALGAVAFASWRSSSTCWPPSSGSSPSRSTSSSTRCS